MSSAAICSTVSSAKPAMSCMNALRSPLAVLDVAELVLPVAGQLRRGELVLLEHRDHLQALRRRLEVAADALDVLAADQRLDRLRARRRRAEAGLLHRLAQLLVVDQLAGGLHRGEQRRLGVAGRRLRLLRLAPRPRRSGRPGPARAAGARPSRPRSPRPGARSSPPRTRGRRRRASPASSVILPRVRKRSSSTSGDHRRALVARRRVEHGEEALRDEVEDAALVRARSRRCRARCRSG